MLTAFDVYTSFIDEVAEYVQFGDEETYLMERCAMVLDKHLPEKWAVEIVECHINWLAESRDTDKFDELVKNPLEALKLI